VLTACAAVGCAPLALAHFRQIAMRPHYQFYPFVILAALVVAAVRFRGYRTARVGSGPVAGAVVGAGLLILLASVILDSSWLGYLSFLVTATGLIYSAAGRDGLRRAAPALALLVLLLPPPFELDRELVFALRRLTTRWSGLVLDALHVPHLMAGNVVELGHRRLMVEEACSGINSLFALLATTLFFAAMFGRSLVHTALLLVATVFWVVVANVARVVTVVIADRRSIDLSDGWRHEALSIATFLAAVALTASTDCLYRLVAARYAAWRARRRDEAATPVAAAVPGPATVRVTRPADFCWSWPATTAVALAFIALAGGHWLLSASAAEASASIADGLNRLTADALPGTFDQWRRVDFRSEHNRPDSAFGEFSKVWTFRRGGTTAIVSADYPFPGWHDLLRCYTSQGWEIRDQELVPGPDGLPAFVEVGLERASFQRGYLLFAEFGPTGVALAPRLGGAGVSLHRQRTALLRLGHRFGLAAEPPPDEPRAEVGQLQLFVQSEASLPADRRSAAQTLFGQTLSAVRGDLRKSREK
jgi:exosortase